MSTNDKGVTLWLTGLPCSGKTTIAEIMKEELEKRGKKVELLDGDEIRKHFSAGVGFSKEDRGNHLRRVAFLCRLLSKHGVLVLASFVSPYRENRDHARSLMQDRFLEIFVDTPVEECIKRDVKGMYKKALAGEIKQFTGISDPYEVPEKPEIVIRTLEESARQSAERVLEFLSHYAGEGVVRGADSNV